MDKILIISKDTGQTQKFIRELPDYLKTTQADFSVDFIFYPHYEESVASMDWDVIGLSPELLVEEKSVRARLKELGVNTRVKAIRGVHFGLRRFDLIFPAILAE